MLDLHEQILVVKKLLKTGDDCYLVGGAIRDLLLGRKIADFDFVCNSDPRIIGRRLADHLGSAFYVMDEKRQTCRVIDTRDSKACISYDFAQMQGNLLEDLRKRDFTINALAINMRDQEQIIDPLKGGRDLQEKWLRPCSGLSFQSDPVRVIRAVRYAVDLKLKIEPQTRKLLSKAIESLKLVSIERKRDEFFKILENQNASTATRLMVEFEILPQLGISGLGDNLDLLRMCEILVHSLNQVGNKAKSDFFCAATFLSAIAPFKSLLNQLFSSRNSNNHSRAQLGKFAALHWNNSKSPESEHSLLNSFSSDEKKFMQTCSDFMDTTLELLNQVGEIDSRTAYRFFNQVGGFCIDLLLLAIAWRARVPAAELNQREWLSVLSNAAKLLDLWFYHPEISRPQPLLNGTEIMQEANLEAGPMIGKLLEELKEEQAAGEIQDHKSALLWVVNRLSQNKAL